METEAVLNDLERTGENSSHLNASGLDASEVEGLGTAQRETLRTYVRRVLGLQRDLQRVLGGTVLAELIADGEQTLERLS